MSLKIRSGGKTAELPIDVLAALPDLLERVEALTLRIEALEQQLRETKDED